MAKLNAELIQQKFQQKSRGESGPRAFMRFMGWNSPSQASDAYYGTGNPTIDTVEQIAFKLRVSPSKLILPEIEDKWPR